MKNYFNIAHFNAQSLKPDSRADKFEEIKDILGGGFLDAVCISETWLKSYRSNVSIAIDGYKVFRNDRPSVRGGGVAIYVLKKLRAKVIARSEEGSEIEYLFVQLCVGTSKVLVGVIYRPSGNLLQLDSVLNNLVPHYQNFIIMGDFNLNLLDDRIFNQCESFFNTYGAKIVHNSFKPTHFDITHKSESLIDFGVVGSEDCVKFNDQFWIPGVSKHAFIYLSINIVQQRSSETYYFRDFKGIKIDLLLQDAYDIDISSLYNTNDVDTQVHFLSSKLLALYNRHVLIKSKRFSKGSNHWYSVEIANTRSLRDLAFQAYKEDKTDERWRTFCKFRNRVNQMVKRAKHSFGLIYYSIDQPTKQLWNKIRGLGVLKNSEDICSDVNPDKLNEYFTGTQTCASTVRSDINMVESNSSLSFRNVTEFELLKAVFTIKSNAIGLDDIPIKFVKLVLPALSSHILYIINNIITTSYFPSTWKLSKIIPIPKKCGAASYSDYRPISILPSLSKIWEILIKQQITDFVDKKICDNQSGFRKFHSTTTAVLDITEEARSNMDKRLATILVLLDFSKAFDTINHSLLCRKLKQQFCFSSSACNMIFSFLTGRLQCVKVGNVFSDFLPVSSGVPQGTILGPLLFSLFINDIDSCIQRCKLHIFADDVQIIHAAPLGFMGTCVSEINSDLSSIYNWSIVNQLTLNPDKTNAIAIYKSSISEMLDPILLNGSVIPFVKKVTNLGIIINETLSWDDHAVYITRNTWGTLRKLYSIKHFLSCDLRRRLVLTLIWPCFLYGCEIFSGCSSEVMHRLKVCFNSAVRFVYSLKRFDHVSAFTTKLIGGQIEQFYEFRILIMLFKILLNRLPRYLYYRLHFIRSSRTCQLLIPKHSSRAMDQSFLIRTSRLWNILPLSFRKLVSVKVFKLNCAIFLGLNR